MDGRGVCLFTGKNEKSSNLGVEGRAWSKEASQRDWYCGLAQLEVEREGHELEDGFLNHALPLLSHTSAAQPGGKMSQGYGKVSHALLPVLVPTANDGVFLLLSVASLAKSGKGL